MKNILVLDDYLEWEEPTVEGRLASLFETDGSVLKLDGHIISDHDKEVIIDALRLVEMWREGRLK